MANYAVVQDSDSMVVNRVVWDGTSAWTPPTGTTAVEDASGTSKITGWYESGIGFHDPMPKIASVDVASGPAAGGTAVTVIGLNFNTPGATVKFDGVEATSIVIVNDTTMTCATPAHVAGLVDVTVENTAGSWTSQNTLTNGFEYTA